MESVKDEYKIKKVVLNAGTEYKACGPGTKVFFHFQTRLCDNDRTIIDDSRKMGKPMELVLGKKFKLEVWETIVQAMAINEVAKFTVDRSLVVSYPFVSKTLRDAGKPNAKRMHCCGTALQAEGIGYEDLNRLIKEPRDLEFIIELLKVENSGEYEEESWQMTEEQKLKSIPHLREEGNNLYKKCQYTAAADKYAQAIGYLEQLMLKEKPHDVEWTELNNMKLPLLLNYAQCKLQTGEYYAVIEHCSTVLESDPDNIKALFRRGKAQAKVWNINEAKSDLGRAVQLDPSLSAAVNSLLTHLSQRVKEQDDLQRKKLQGKIFS